MNTNALATSRLVAHQKAPLAVLILAVLIIGLLVVAPRGWGAPTNLDRYYPQDAVDSCRGGWVIAEFYVSAEGAVRDIDVLDSHPKGMFDEAAKRLLSKYVFYPSRQQYDRRQQRIEFEAHGCSLN